MKLDLNKLALKPTDTFSRRLDVKQVEQGEVDKRRKRKKFRRPKKIKNKLGPDQLLREFFFYTRGI